MILKTAEHMIALNLWMDWLQNMTNRRIIIIEEAENDISNIEEYIAQDNVNAAKEFVIKLKKSFINL